MVKANELRLGNWILFRNHLQPDRYVQINARFFSSLAGGRPLEEIKFDEELNGYYHGIPLTPERLEQCGFEHREKESRITNIKTFHVYTKNDFTFNSIHGWWFNNKQLDRQPEYLHQLQNLIFSLTGEELIYQPIKELT